jgi:hypothetical protein
MAIFDCKECRARISDKAGACPQCGALINGGSVAYIATAKPKKKTSVVTWVALIFAGIVILPVFVQRAAQRASESGSPKAEPVERQIIKLSPSEILAWYTDNEIKTNDLIRGKLIEVTGTILEISEFMGDAYFQLDTGDKWHHVRANIVTGERSRAGQFSKGATVTVRCPRANFVINSPQLRECWIM